jgi:DNA-binding SARP family transcriptional activator
VETSDGDEISFRYGENPIVQSKNAHRGPELLAYLALRTERAASLDEIRDHLWWGGSVGRHSIDNLLSATRKVLGGAAQLGRLDDDPDRRRYKLAPTVVTDVDLLQHAVDHARALAETDPRTSVELLRRHLARIEAPAFRSDHLGQGLAEWAAAYRIRDRVDEVVVTAGLLAADLDAARGPQGLPDALWAVDQALLASRTNEALVRAGMELEARLGNRDAANHRYTALTTQLSLDDLEPEPETIKLRNRIMSSSYKVG